MATALTTRAVNRPLTNWVLNHPVVRRFYGSKGGYHGEKAHAHGHHDHHDPRHFELPGESAPFPTYPSSKVTVGLTLWGFIFSPMTLGAFLLGRAKGAK